MEKLEFKIDDIVLKHLTQCDDRLAILIKLIGDYILEFENDYFPSLVRTIIGQQLSMGAAQTIWLRTLNLCDSVTPETVISISEFDFRSIGVSRAKTTYIKDLSRQVVSGKINFDILKSLPNEDIISVLTSVKGIGKWTAEMFLIFGLGRLNVFSLGDVGLKRSIQWLYDLDAIPEEKALKEFEIKWSPYQSVASLYLWEVINSGLIKSPFRDLKNH